MTKYYADHLLEALWLHETKGKDYNTIAWEHGYTKGVTDTIRGTFNRFVKIGATEDDVAAWVYGEYLRSMKALEYHLRFVGGRNRQISAADLAKELNVYDVKRLKKMLRGLTMTQPELCNYTNTLGLDCLSIF